MDKLRKSVFVGFDGFIDNISVVVSKRSSIGDGVEKINQITGLADKIARSAGKNANIELCLAKRKLGGNGPLLANGLLSAGVEVKYIGLLGEPIDAIFKDFADKSNAISVGNPGETHALEFDDGKIMFCYTKSVERLTYEKIIEVVGEEHYCNILSNSDVLVFENWTMLLNLTDILQKTFFGKTGEKLKQGQHAMFFDMADPAKRSKIEVLQFLELLKKIEEFGTVTLSLNRSEAEYVADVFEIKLPDVSDADEFKQMFYELKNKIGISSLVCHFAKGAFWANSQKCYFQKSYSVQKVFCLTGSGDNFNAGFISGLISGKTPINVLKTAHAFAAVYISNGEISNVSEIDKLINQHEI